MPKFGSHIIFAERAFYNRPDLFPNCHLNALRFGAIGPDVTLFMFDPTINEPTVREGYNVCLKTLQSIRHIREKVDAITTELGQPIADLENWITGGLKPALSETVNMGIEAMVMAIKLGLAFQSSSINLNNPIFKFLTEPNLPADFITNPEWRKPSILVEMTDNYGFPFRMFGHPYTDDGNWKSPYPAGDYSKWWWMDLLHYRKTFTFAQELLKQANGRVQTSYAKGYMTHVAGDISGHPFINSLVGGPFRNHAFRHLVLETLADTWLWENQGKGDILDAELDTQIDLSSAEENEIAALMIRTMRAVYPPTMVPAFFQQGYPSTDDFIGGYRTLKEYLHLSTSGNVKRPTAPPNTPEEIIKEIQDLLKNNVPGPPPKWIGSWKSFLKAVFKWFSKGLVLLVMLATLPTAVLTRIITVSPRWALYLIQLALYYLISGIRTMLCLVGWGYAGSDDFNNFSFLRGLIQSGNYDADYPYQTLPNPKPPLYWLEPVRWMGRTEQNFTRPQAIWSRVFPDWMVDQKNNLMQPHMIKLFSQAATPAETRELYRLLEDYPFAFGNAIDFSVALLDGMEIADFDLDGDRGYGYKGWGVLPPNENYNV